MADSSPKEAAPALVSHLTFFGRTVVVACDGNCAKAWGINSRPQVANDEVWCSDAELGVAPADPGTYEGADAKPLSLPTIHNKWCVRECERSVMAKPDEDLPLPDFTERVDV